VGPVGAGCDFDDRDLLRPPALVVSSGVSKSFLPGGCGAGLSDCGVVQVSVEVVRPDAVLVQALAALVVARVEFYKVQPGHPLIRQIDEEIESLIYPPLVYGDAGGMVVRS
jgi:hypothetical protein